MHGVFRGARDSARPGFGRSGRFGQLCVWQTGLLGGSLGSLGQKLFGGLKMSKQRNRMRSG